MAMKVRYEVINGEVIAEKRGGIRRCYVPDPLGSTVALLDNTQAQTDTFTYWPYGEVKTRTGTTATPFQFVGTLGYYRDSSSRTYVRARVDRMDLTRWQTEDPIGFDGGDWNLYRNVLNMPTSWADPSGLLQAPFPPPDTKPPLPQCLTLCSKLKLQGHAWELCMLQCLKKNGGKQDKYCAYVVCFADPLCAKIE